MLVLFSLSFYSYNYGRSELPLIEKVKSNLNKMTPFPYLKVESFDSDIIISKDNSYIAVINDLDFNLLAKSKFEPKVLDLKKKEGEEEKDKNIGIPNNIFEQIDLISFINRYFWIK